MNTLNCKALTGLVVIFLFLNGNVGASTIEITVIDKKGNPLESAVATLTSPDAISNQQSTSNATINQVNKEFVPEVSVVQAGTAITFPNNDRVRHHVYSFSDAKSFDLPLYRETSPDPVIFDKPGLVTLGCNIHDWMRAYVVVVETPFYQMSGANGKILIDNIPAGKYELELWHPRQRKTFMQEVEVNGDDIALELVIPTKPKFRAKRRNSGDSGQYQN